MNDLDRRDPCNLHEGTLFSGGYALVYGGPKEFHGKMVFLSQTDEHGWWESFDRKGDMLILNTDWLMPVSEPNWDNKTDLDTFLYEARYGS